MYYGNYDPYSPFSRQNRRYNHNRRTVSSSTLSLDEKILYVVASVCLLFALIFANLV